MRFIKSTIFKGGETRGKSKRKLEYNICFTAVRSICEIFQVLN